MTVCESAFSNKVRISYPLSSSFGVSTTPLTDPFSAAELALVRQCLNVGPEDQSLWFYFQFLLLNLTESGNWETIAPGLADGERQYLITHTISWVEALTIDYPDIKWPFVAALDCFFELAKVEKRPITKRDLYYMDMWLQRLRKLDPMRVGRWNDLEMEYKSHAV